MKLKNILIIAMVIITLGLVVACSDDVVVSNKDNGLAYTSVLESNGAFEYNGTKYESLQLALDAIANGKGIVPYKTVKVLRDVASSPAIIAEEQCIKLDLGGHTVNFYDVTDNALSIGRESVVEIVNGTMTLQDKGNAKLAVIYAKDANVSIENGVSINEGTLVVNNSNLTVRNNMGAGIALNSSIVTVIDGGHAIIDSVSGEYTVNACDTSAITNNTGYDINVNTGDCYLMKDGAPTIYSDFEHALSNVGDNADTIVFIKSVTYTSSYTLSHNLTIDLNGCNVTLKEDENVKNLDGGIYKLSIIDSDANSQAQLTANVSAGEMVVVNAKVDGTVNTTGDLVSLGSKFNGTVDAVNLTDNGSTFKNAVVVSADLNSKDATFEGTVHAGSLTDEHSTFSASVTASGRIMMTRSILNPAGNIDKFVCTDSTAADAISMTGVQFNYDGDNKHAGVWADKGGSISMTNSTGKAYKIVATDNSGNHTPGTVTIDNSALTEGSFIVKDNVWSVVGDSPDEYFGDVIIKGYDKEQLIIDRIYANDITISRAKVLTDATAKTSNGSSDHGDVISDNCWFSGNITASGTVTDGTKSGEAEPYTFANGSTFEGPVSAGGAVILYSSFTKASVTSGVSVSAHKAKLGQADGTPDDTIYAPEIIITDGSYMRLKALCDKSGYDDIAAEEVSIDKTVNYDEYDYSLVDSIIATQLSLTEPDIADNQLQIGSIQANNLTVTAVENRLAVGSISAVEKTTLTGGRYTNGTAGTDHIFNGATTITGGIFTGDVNLGGSSANSIKNAVFDDGTSYGSFTFSGTGSLTVEDVSFLGNTTFSGGHTTINGNITLGHYTSGTDYGWTNFTDDAHVTFDNTADNVVYLGSASNSSYVSIANGHFCVASGAGLGYAGSCVDQLSNQDSVTITVVDDTVLYDDVYLNSAIKNLSIVVATGKTLYLNFDYGTDTYYSNVYLCSPTGHYSLSGKFNDSTTSSGTSTNCHVYYRLGVGISYSISGNVGVQAHTF